MKPLVSVSVVSHRHGPLLVQLLGDIERHCRGTAIEILLTLNVPERLEFDIRQFRFLVQLIENRAPRGFGANHNAALERATGSYFCVLNPDVRLAADPFPALVGCLAQDRCGCVAPLVRAPDGTIEDSARRFPTPWRILRKLIARIRGRRVPVDYDIAGTGPVAVDWVAGMFMLFRRDGIERIGGFDERYFLYYEDVDLCARLRVRGETVYVCPQVEIVHTARRQSHREWRYRRWHLASMMRFFLSSVYRRLVFGRRVAEPGSPA